MLSPLLGVAAAHPTLAADPLEKRSREIALRRVGEDNDDHLACKLRLVGEAYSSSGRSPAGDPDQDALLPGKPPGKLERLVARDLLHLIDDGEVEGVRDETGADPLNLVRPGLELQTGELLRDERALPGLDRDGENLLPAGVLDVS